MPKDLMISIALMIFLVMGFALVEAMTLTINKEGEPTQYGVIFNPFLSESEILNKIVKAEGYLVRPTLFDNITIVASKKNTFKEQAYQQGAYLIINPMILGSCFSKDQTAFKSSQ